MFINIKNEKNKSVVSFIDCDRIDTTNLKLIKEQLTPIISEVNSSSKKDEQVLDFYNINFIDSSGLTMIINLYKKLLEHDKSLKIINVNEIVFNIFDVTKLNTFVDVSR